LKYQRAFFFSKKEKEKEPSNLNSLKILLIQYFFRHFFPGWV
jgi:hypothetical protein